MNRKIFTLAALLSASVLIEKAEADCPPQITGDDIDSLRKGNTISGTAGDKYELHHISPKESTIKPNAIGYIVWSIAQPTYCSYTVPGYPESTFIQLKQK